jgi:dynein heavy chain
VVNRETDTSNGADDGPLTEVQFWSSRTIDLSGIHEQIEKPGVKRIVAALAAAKSSYLKPFLDLSRIIQEGREEAVDNLRFLSNLTAPCERLAAAAPAEIPGLLPPILHVIRLVWRYSRFYHTDERLTGLLRKVSNEVISRYRGAISTAEILDGDVEASTVTLQQSIAAGEAWRRVYGCTKAAIDADKGSAGGRSWDGLDNASIFAQVDALVSVSDGEGGKELS